MSTTGTVVKRHLRVDRFHQSKNYKSQKQFRRDKVPVRANPATHGSGLASQVRTLQQDYSTLSQSWEGQEDIRARGLVIEIESAPGVELRTERLLGEGLELLNQRDVRDPNNCWISKQTWFVPDGKLGILANFLTEYLTKTRKYKGTVKPKNRDFAESIEKIGKATAKQLWTENDTDFPSGETIWFEVWLRAGGSVEARTQILEQFRTLAKKQNLKVGEGRIDLPEHTVVACYGTADSFTFDLALLNCVAELRRGRDYADFFEGLTISDQGAFISDLLRRVKGAPSNAPFVSVLDTGVNRAHPALERYFPEANNLTIKSAWSAGDDDNHGTLMAGLCLYGNLTGVLGSSEEFEVLVNIEGVKIVPPVSERGSDEKLAGYYTAQGVAIAESKAPTRQRVFCLTTTMKGPNDPRPTSWSSTLDSLAVGADADGKVRRLFCLSSGNVHQDKWIGYPDSNLEHEVENPSQSWNALCVGSFTDYDLIQPANKEYRPVARRGCMSPTNSSSRTWDNPWPNKPDVVFEGGNAGFHEATKSTLQLPELMLLSTAAEFRDGQLGTCCGSSASTALVSRMAGELSKAYPDYWPETIRALLVHSASWTDPMKTAIPSEIDGMDRIRFLLRTVGYGVPNLAKAIASASSRATLIGQCELKPFKTEGSEVVYNEMHLHALPWPERELAKHSAESIRLRLTLSYFVEPNPGNRGYTSTFRYPGCQLRFRVASPGQTAADLEAQVSKLAAEEMKKEKGQRYVKGSTKGWEIGQQCQRGSIHSDTWEGSCADLLSMKHIAVYPITGWWRTRPSQGRAEASIKYSLVVSIESENPSIDIFTEIETAILIPVPIPV